MSAPDLVLSLHGTRDAGGVETGCQIAAAVAARLPQVRVRLGWIELVEPLLTDAVTPGCVVVTCLLGAGYHVREDIRLAAESVPDAVATDPLGPVDAVLSAVQDRVEESGGVAERMLLGWAGSTDPVSQAQVQDAAAELSRRWQRPVEAVTHHQAPARVAELRAAGAGSVGLATYLIAPGRFATALTQVGADRTSAPLGTHPALISLLVQRYLDVAFRS